MGEYYEPGKKYGHDGILGVLDAGASTRGGAAAAKKADLNQMVTNLDADMQLRGGVITSDEHAAMTQEGAKRVQDDYSADMKRVNTVSVTNMVTNSAGIILSCAGLAGTAAGGKLGTKAGSYFAGKAANATGVKAVGYKVAEGVSKGLGGFGSIGTAKKVETLVKGGEQVTKEVFKHSLKTRALLGVGKLAVVSAPAGAAMVYTHGRTDELVTDLDNQAGALQATYDYLTSEDDSLTDQIRSDTEQWTKSYEEQGQALLDAYNRGELTQEQYNEKYEAYVAEHDAMWAEFKQGHSDTAEYVTQHGTAYAANQYAVDKGLDPNTLEENCTYIADRNAQNPNAKAAAESAFETQQKLSTGSTFTDFLANMNAVMLHYVPGLVYAEAAFLKVGDVVADFAANKVPGLSTVFDYEEKHKGESLGDIAKAICTDAEARYELSHAVSQDELTLAAGMDPGTDRAPSGPELSPA